MKARPLTLPQLQAARAAFDAIKAQRELTAEERREADRLDQRFYLRCWRAQQAQAEQRFRERAAGHAA